jgi:hypothetical protein
MRSFDARRAAVFTELAERVAQLFAPGDALGNVLRAFKASPSPKANTPELYSILDPAAYDSLLDTEPFLHVSLLNRDGQMDSFDVTAKGVITCDRDMSFDDLADAASDIIEGLDYLRDQLHAAA